MQYTHVKREPSWYPCSEYIKRLFSTVLFIYLFKTKRAAHPPHSPGLRNEISSSARTMPFYRPPPLSSFSPSPTDRWTDRQGERLRTRHTETVCRTRRRSKKDWRRYRRARVSHRLDFATLHFLISWTMGLLQGYRPSPIRVGSWIRYQTHSEVSISVFYTFTELYNNY